MSLYVFSNLIGFNKCHCQSIFVLYTGFKVLYNWRFWHFWRNKQFWQKTREALFGRNIWRRSGHDLHNACLHNESCICYLILTWGAYTQATPQTEVLSVPNFLIYTWPFFALWPNFCLRPDFRSLSDRIFVIARIFAIHSWYPWSHCSRQRWAFSAAIFLFEFSKSPKVRLASSTFLT